MLYVYAVHAVMRVYIYLDKFACFNN